MLRREKPVCITKRPASNSIQSTDVSSRPACTCAYLLRHSFPLASSRRLIPSHSIAFLPRIGCEEYYQSPGRASFSRFRTSCRKFFLPDFAYPFNFDICRSQFRSALQNESRNVASSASCISFTAFRFLLAILKRVHENFNIFKKKLMKNKIFFWSLYISYFNVYRNFLTRSKSYAILL